MNRDLLRGTLYGMSFSLPFWALVVVWFSLGAAVVLAILAALAWIAAGLVEVVR